ncbi:hypothetical protein SAY86_002483 [Trapa natans]|uniref:protein-serine/threonine phosphatase n=1 Tax=Trapa natans TaxID=22666 RepID=A0AAN7QZL6_TRANT|nr:hypothetical protein SAY86_002483 [Trapa natans]
MENMSSPVAVTLNLGNTLSDNSGVSSSMEITRLKLVANAASLISSSSKLMMPTDLCSDVATEDLNLSRGVDGSDGMMESRDSVDQEIDKEVLSVIGSTIGLTSLDMVKSVEVNPASAQAVILGVTVEAPKGGLITSLISKVEVSSRSTLNSSDVISQFPKEKISSKGGIRSVFELECIPLWGSVSICGKRHEMEDSVSSIPRFLRIPIKMLMGDHAIDGIKPSLTHVISHFFGVYDGHGGPQVANYCREHIHFALAEEICSAEEHLNLCNGIAGDRRQVQWEGAFKNCFQRVDDEIGGKVSRLCQNEGVERPSGGVCCEPVAHETVGSTAVVALVCSSHIIVANCGDSRAVLLRGKESMALSVDHKPDLEKEYTRIEAAGGKVIQWKGYRVFGVLAMSRSLGDRYLKPWIIPEPEVMFLPRVRDDELLILASDGLWDVMTNQEACEAARRRILQWHKRNGGSTSSPSPSSISRGEGVDPAAQSAADYLSRLAIEKGSEDNISVIVIDLKAQRKFKTKS